MTLISVSSDPEELLAGRCLKEDCPVIVVAPSEWQLNRGIARHFHRSHPDQIEKVNPSVRSLGKKCTYLNTNQEARERTLFRKINRLNGKRRPCRCPVKDCTKRFAHRQELRAHIRETHHVELQLPPGYMDHFLIFADKQAMQVAINQLTEMTHDSYRPNEPSWIVNPRINDRFEKEWMDNLLNTFELAKGTPWYLLEIIGLQFHLMELVQKQLSCELNPHSGLKLLQEYVSNHERPLGNTRLAPARNSLIQFDFEGGNDHWSATINGRSYHIWLRTSTNPMNYYYTEEGRDRSSATISDRMNIKTILCC